MNLFQMKEYLIIAIDNFIRDPEYIGVLLIRNQQYNLDYAALIYAEDDNQGWQ